MRFNLLLLFCLACDSAQEYETCTLVDSTLSFESEDLLCVQVDMHWRAFRQLSKQNRFGGAGSEQLQGAIGHIMTSCTEPFPDPFTYYPAELQVGSLSLVDVGIRKKGFVGSVMTRSKDRPSLKIKADKYIEGQLVDGYEKVTLNNNLTDPTRIHTCLTYQIFRENGYPAPRCNLANVMMNGVSLGAYTHVEDVKEAFLEREFGNADGSLYEITIVDFSLEHLQDGIGRWEPKTEATQLNEDLLIGVAEALLSDNEDLEDELGAVLDIDAFIRFWALETVTSHSDGYSQGSNNAFVYFDPDQNDKAIFIPWGPDDALQSMDLVNIEEEGFLETDIFYVNGAISRRLSQHPELMTQYLMELERLITVYWNEDDLHNIIDQYVSLVTTVEPESEVYLDLITDFKSWIDGRHDTIESYIQSGGVEGIPGPMECYGEEDTTGMNDIGDLVTAASHSCAYTSHPHQHLWLMGPLLLCIQRRKHHTH